MDVICRGARVEGCLQPRVRLSAVPPARPRSRRDKMLIRLLHQMPTMIVGSGSLQARQFRKGLEGGNLLFGFRHPIDAR
jgi:hypothetical protein